MIKIVRMPAFLPVCGDERRRPLFRRAAHWRLAASTFEINATGDLMTTSAFQRGP
jgi:hypothetical protein